jgi:hypothetical protein
MKGFSGLSNIKSKVKSAMTPKEMNQKEIKRTKTKTKSLFYCIIVGALVLFCAANITRNDDCKHGGAEVSAPVVKNRIVEFEKDKEVELKSRGVSPRVSPRAVAVNIITDQPRNPGWRRRHLSSLSLIY